MPSRWLLALVALAMFAVVAGAVWLYSDQERSLRARAQNELQAIAELKTGQIVSWRTQHLKTAERLSSSRLYAQIVADWAASPTEAAEQGIVQRMRAEQPSGDYFSVLLLDVEGTELLRIGQDAGSAEAHVRLYEGLEEAIAVGQPLLSDLHRGPGTLPVHLDVIAPLYYEHDGELVSPGAIVLQSSAEDFLYPLVQSWPTPSSTAETALVIRDGDSVVFLNDLRHRDDAALELRIPMTQADNPAVMAVTGSTGIVEGVDYRGERVFAYVTPVPGSDWYMVAKIDVAEALADWRDRASLIVLLSVGLLASIGVAFGFAWQSGRAARLNSMLDTERILRDSEQKHGALLEGLVTIAQAPWKGAEQMHRLVLGEAMRLTQSRAARLCAVSEGSMDPVVGSCLDVSLDDGREMHPPFLSMFGEACALVLRERDPAVVHSPAPETGPPAANDGDPTISLACLAVPVFADGRIVAVAAVAGSGIQYTGVDQRRLGVLMDSVWKVVRRYEAEEEVRVVNASLEQIVYDRTEELEATNRILQQANRDLIEANEAKTRFLRAMSHELRTPLNSIIGFSGVMLDGLAGEMTDEQRHQLEMVNRSGRHLLNLINDILDLSRIEAGKADMQIESFDAHALAQDVYETVGPAAHRKGLKTALELSENGGCRTLISDPVKVRQILLNLIGNAVKFTESGVVTLSVQCDTPGWVKFAVADTGPGIPEEEHETIFGEFTQRQRTFAVQHEGTGLGLAISRGLAGLLGGTVSIASSVGEGSTFTLELPIERSGAAARGGDR